MRHWALAAAAVLAAAPAAAAPTPWLEVKSAHFTVITDAGEKDGRRAAWQFEQIRSALVQIWPWAKIDSGRPFVVFAARNEATQRTLGPQFWEGKRFRPAGFGAEGRDRHFIAVRTDVAEPDEAGTNPYQTAYWTYVSAVFNRSFPGHVPDWYARGVAEVMSNTIVRDKELHVGRPIRENIELVRDRVPVPLPELLAADRRSHWLTQEGDVNVFDAHAWALVHYLMFANQGALAPRMGRFNRLLFEGKDPGASAREAFGDMQPHYDEMRKYVQRSLFAYSRIPVSLDTRPEAYAVRALSPDESAVLRGELLVAMDRPLEARAFAAEARKADPAARGPWEIEADLLDREDRRDDARAAYAKAAEAGSKRARVYYRLAQLEWSPSADSATRERLAADLEKARVLDPEDADTLSFLADLRTDLGQADQALPLARKAVEIEPAGSYHRLALARALWQQRKPAEATQAARVALQTADDDSERRTAQEFLDFTARAAAPSSESRAESVSAEAEASGPPASLMESLDRQCRGGHKPSCAHLASFEALGQVAGRDAAAARARLEALCKDGTDEGCIGWALVLASSRPPDMRKARELLEGACARKSEEACQIVKTMPR
jgi:tetratricopeptide (TPR) repeat protein